MKSPEEIERAMALLEVAARDARDEGDIESGEKLMGQVVILAWVLDSPSRREKFGMAWKMLEEILSSTERILNLARKVN